MLCKYYDLDGSIRGREGGGMKIGTRLVNAGNCNMCEVLYTSMTCRSRFSGRQATGINVQLFCTTLGTSSWSCITPDREVRSEKYEGDEEMTVERGRKKRGEVSRAVPMEEYHQLIDTSWTQ